MQSTAAVNIQELLSADNATRKRAEDNMNQEFAKDPANLARALISGLSAGQPEAIATMSCICLKKYYLDAKATAQLDSGDLETFKQAIVASLDFSSQTMSLLKRKGDVLSKIYSKLEQNGEFLTKLVAYAGSQVATERQFAMYAFEVLSEMHLSPEELKQYHADFKTIFTNALGDSEVQVKVAALKAISAFISALEDTDVVLGFKDVLPLLIKTIVTVLQVDEDQGRQALDSLGELSSAHAEVWRGCTGDLVNLVADICSLTDFEPGTRAAAAEVILSLSSVEPAPLRKIPETQTKLLPAFVKMLMEDDRDDATWAEEAEEGQATGLDSVATA